MYIYTCTCIWLHIVPFINGLPILFVGCFQDEAESEPVSHEVGIDIGAEALASQTSQTGGNLSQTGLASQTSHTGGNLSQTGLASQTSHTGLASQTSQTGLGSQTSQASITPGVSLSAEMDASQSSTDMEVRG